MKPDLPGLDDLYRAFRRLEEDLEFRLLESENADLVELSHALWLKRGCRR